MYNSIFLENAAIFREFTWKNPASINIVIGKNDTGKTHLLKILYSIAKSLEIYAKQQSQPPTVQESFPTILSKKLLWTFQPESPRGLAELITKGQKRIRVETVFNDREIVFSFGEDTKQSIKDITQSISIFKDLSVIFIPSKEVLTSFEAIAATREQLKIFGFDDTYYDLITALRLPVSRGKIDRDIKPICDTLESLFKGKIIREKNKFIFQKEQEKFTMSQVAEGVKKVGIITNLLRNHALRSGSILFLDEPENNLHPEAILKLVEILFSLSQIGIQIYLSTHSYFVIKQFEILARKKQTDVSICSLIEENNKINYQLENLRFGLPMNPIIETSIQLYEQDLKIGLR